MPEATVRRNDIGMGEEVEVSPVEMQKELRIKVMDEYNYEDTEQYLQYFREGYLDKDNRGFNELYSLLNQYWEGIANTPDSVDSPNSNTNIIHGQVEGHVSYIADKDISIEVLGREPGDHAFAETVEKVLQWVSDQNNPTDYQDDYVRKLTKYGHAMYRVMYDPEWDNGFGLPTIETPNPGYIYVDPTIVNSRFLNDARFIIEAENRSRTWARQQPHFNQESVESMSAGYDPHYFEYLFGEDVTDNYEIEDEEYIHLYVWTKVRGRVEEVEEMIFKDDETGEETKVEAGKTVIQDEDGEWITRLVEMSGDGFMLYDSFEAGEVFPGGYPYFHTNMFKRDGSMWGMGVAELLRDNQDLINDIDDQIRQSIRLSANPQRVVNIASKVDIDKLTNEAGLVIPSVLDAASTMQYMKTPTFPAYAVDRRKYAVEVEKSMITRFSDQMLGQRQKGVDTATESLSLQQSGMMGIDHTKALVQSTMGDMFEYILELLKIHWTEEKIIRVTGQDDVDFIFFDAQQLNNVPFMKPADQEYKNIFKSKQMEMGIAEPEEPKWMEDAERGTKSAKFDIKIDVGAGLPSNKAFMYQLVREMFTAQLITPQQFKSMIEQYVGLIIPDEEPMQGQGMPGQMPQGPVQDQQVQGVMSSGQPQGVMPVG